MESRVPMHLFSSSGIWKHNKLTLLSALLFHKPRNPMGITLPLFAETHGRVHNFHLNMFKCCHSLFYFVSYVHVCDMYIQVCLFDVCGHMWVLMGVWERRLELTLEAFLHHSPPYSLGGGVTAHKAGLDSKLTLGPPSLSPECGDYRLAAMPT